MATARSTSRGALALLAILLPAIASEASGPARLVKDIVTTPSPASANPYGDTLVVGSTLYFVWWSEETGQELWKSDGSAAGTVLVKDICPGTCDSSPRELTDVDGTVFFVASDGRLGVELWRSDGTAAGTRLVKDIVPGGAGPAMVKDVRLDVRKATAGRPLELSNVNGTLFFIGWDESHGYELWASDGTAAGTRMVRDILPGPESGTRGEFVNLNGLALFAGYDANGAELWRSDGTEAGTFMILDLNEGDASSWAAGGAVMGELFYFAAEDSVNGTELWKTDGTAAGTALVKDILPGPSGSSPYYLTVAGGLLFFVVVDDGISGRELWKSDGSADGTVLVKDVWPGPTGSYPVDLTAFGGRLYLTATDEAHGRELWTSDGTADGTVLVKDIDPFGYGWPQLLTVVGNTLYFIADVPGLWKTDGTGAGTTLVQAFTGTRPIGGADGTLFLFATDAAAGARMELWRSDGTAAGTKPITQTTTRGANPRQAVDVNGTLFFTGSGASADQPEGLWKTDGTEAGTLLVAGEPTICGSPSSLTALGNSALFVAYDCVSTWRLWKSDGTASGTVPVSPPEVHADSRLITMGGLLYFVADDSAHGQEIWRTDGTTAGTVIVKDIRSGVDSSWPSELTAVGNTLFFTAYDGTGSQLWRSDGTSSGTWKVKTISAYGEPIHLTDVAGTLFFAAYQEAAGYELWRSDGTAAGTVMVKDILPGSMSAMPEALTSVGGTLFFTALDSSAYGLWGPPGDVQGPTGYELWKSDGTSAGTVRVADIMPGSGSSYPSNLKAVGSTLFFTADDGVHGNELWKSDGSGAGTVMVIDMIPGPEPGRYMNLAATPGGVLFMSDDGIHGAEPWFSDGTLAGAMDRADLAMTDEGRLFGTRMLQDINPGPGSGGLGMGFTPGLGGTFFGATDGETGIELWWLPPALSVDNAAVSEGDSGSVSATLNVTLSQASTAPVTVGYATVDGSAVAGEDYTASSGTLTFLPGETVKTITVAVLGDTAAEANEALNVTLSDTVRAYIADGQGQVMVLDDETSGVVAPVHPQPLWQGYFAVDTRETPYVGDFDGDGRTDIVTFTRNNPVAVGDVYVSLSNGAGFAASAKWHDWFAVSPDETVVIGDYDGDGKDDIATWLGTTSRQVYVALSSGSGMAPAQVWLDAIGFASSDVLLSGDANGDGRQDLVLFARTQGKVYVASSTGAGFAAPTVWHEFFAVSTSERPRVADVDGDTRDDIVTFATDSPTAYGDVYVALSTGAQFGDKQNSTKWHDWFAIDPDEEIRIGDLNGDRKDDFFTFLPPARGGEYYTVLSLGQAMAPNVLGPQKVRLEASDRVFVGDVNGDRTADVIVFAQATGKVYVAVAP